MEATLSGVIDQVATKRRRTTDEEAKTGGDGEDPMQEDDGEDLSPEAITELLEEAKKTFVEKVSLIQNL